MKKIIFTIEDLISLSKKYFVYSNEDYKYINNEGYYCLIRNGINLLYGKKAISCMSYNTFEYTYQDSNGFYHFINKNGVDLLDGKNAIYFVFYDTFYYEYETQKGTYYRYNKDSICVELDRKFKVLHDMGKYLIIEKTIILWNLKKTNIYYIFNTISETFEKIKTYSLNEVYGYIKINSIEYNSDTPKELIEIFKFANNSIFIQEQSQSIEQEIKELKTTINKKEIELIQFKQQKLNELIEKKQNIQSITEHMKKEMIQLKEQGYSIEQILEMQKLYIKK